MSLNHLSQIWGQVHFPPRHRSAGKQAIEATKLILKLAEQRMGERRTAVRLAELCELDQPLWLVNRHHPQHDYIDKAENRCVGTDAKCQRANRGCREKRALSQQAHAMARIAEEVAQPAKGALIAN